MVWPVVDRLRLPVRQGGQVGGRSRRKLPRRRRPVCSRSSSFTKAEGRYESATRWAPRRAGPRRLILLAYLAPRTGTPVACTESAGGKTARAAKAHAGALYFNDPFDFERVGGGRDLSGLSRHPVAGARPGIYGFSPCRDPLASDTSLRKSRAAADPRRTRAGLAVVPVRGQAIDARPV